MDWIQIATVCGYTTGVCFFFYRLNDKTIREWREEHTNQINKNEAHWREMFIFMSGRIDSSKENNPIQRKS